jgi:hypothetical protein
VGASNLVLKSIRGKTLGCDLNKLANHAESPDTVAGPSNLTVSSRCSDGISPMGNRSLTHFVDSAERPLLIKSGLSAVSAISRLLRVGDRQNPTRSSHFTLSC